MLVGGGVLVGQDLIEETEIRAQVSQVTKYNAAVHTFQNKYNVIPRDSKYSDASAFGFYYITFGLYIGYLVIVTVMGLFILGIQ